jgi:hypothetical protein
MRVLRRMATTVAKRSPVGTVKTTYQKVLAKARQKRGSWRRMR